MKPVIVADRVSKKYSRNAYRHLSYGVRDIARELMGHRADDTLREDEFLAVDRASFFLEPGESLGIIGRNGSGKSTLLKMINGLIKPDAGSLIVSGRVQALINLGAGFHPHLSGRDNIYNAAAILGLGRRAVAAIEDAIIEFAELEDVIDSPFSSYSRGMQARLGFSVGIHLEPDILLVDEILSVGDFAFQNKCFIRMHELKNQGVTIILVSHSHTQVVQLCERAMWLHEGRTRMAGPAKKTVQAYLDFLAEESARELGGGTGEEQPDAPAPEQPHNEHLEGLSARFVVDGAAVDSFAVHAAVSIEVAFTLRHAVKDLQLNLYVFREDWTRMTGMTSRNGEALRGVCEGTVRFGVDIPDWPVNPGLYLLQLQVQDGAKDLYKDVVRRFAVLGDGRLHWEYADLPCEYRVIAPPEAARTDTA